MALALRAFAGGSGRGVPKLESILGVTNGVQDAILVLQVYGGLRWGELV